MSRPPEVISKLLSISSDELERLTAAERLSILELASDWSLYARPGQLPPDGDWFLWVLRAGRGYGKTRTGAEYVRSRVDAGDWGVVNIAGPF